MLCNGLIIVCTGPSHHGTNWFNNSRHSFSHWRIEHLKLCKKGSTESFDAYIQRFHTLASTGRVLKWTQLMNIIVDELFTKQGILPGRVDSSQRFCFKNRESWRIQGENYEKNWWISTPINRVSLDKKKRKKEWKNREEKIIIFMYF